mgnify:CR=1 FL=1
MVSYEYFRDGKTIQEIANAYQISKNHLMKIVQELNAQAYVLAVRGKNGGLKLNQEPKDINVGEVITETEPNMDIVECFNPEKNSCCIAGNCKLTGLLRKANSRFVQELKNYTLADLL